MNNLKAWMLAANPHQQARVAAAAGTSRKYLYHLANDEAAYARSASASLARRLEAAIAEVNAEDPRLPRVLRVDLCEACRECEFAAKCLGNDAIVEADFRHINNN